MEEDGRIEHMLDHFEAHQDISDTDSIVRKILRGALVNPQSTPAARGSHLGSALDDRYVLEKAAVANQLGKGPEPRPQFEQVTRGNPVVLAGLHNGLKHGPTKLLTAAPLRIREDVLRPEAVVLGVGVIVLHECRGRSRGHVQGVAFLAPHKLAAILLEGEFSPVLAAGRARDSNELVQSSMKPRVIAGHGFALLGEQGRVSQLGDLEQKV